MPDTPLPFSIRQWMRDRHWGSHHLEWHTTRQWDRLSPAEVAEATSFGWQRAAHQEGEATNGFEFLMMHRAMLQLLREAFPTQTALFAGWPTPPTNPNDSVDPVPAGNPQPFRQPMLDAITRLTDNLTSFANDDELGLYIETRARPAPGNPFGTSADPSTGIHNYLHNRFSDSTSPVNMGDPEKNLENTQFWRLHGWIDSRWTAFRASRGLSDSDPAFLQALQRERQHLAGHVMDGRHMLALAAMPAPMPVRTASASLRNPFGESLARRFQRLMTATPEITTLDELKDYLQTAIMLEQATLPLYLCAMWSADSTKPENGAIIGIIRGIVFQEMLHMGLACNLLKAVGGTPKINTPDVVQQFPDYLPGVQLADKVDLRPLSVDRVKLFMKIEQPLTPIPPVLLGAASAVPRFPTIGEFYAAIDRGLVKVNPSFTTTGQLTIDIRDDSLTIIANLDQAREAIKLIQEQGEGTPASQGATEFGNGLAHFYQFQQIDEQKRYVLQGSTFKLDPGSPLPFPPAANIFEMAPVPAGGYPGVPEADAFDKLYSDMLGKLQSAWDNADDTALMAAVTAMRKMKSAAVTLMKKAIPPGGQGNYGPAFRLVPVSPPTPPSPPVPPTAAAAGIRPVPRVARSPAPALVAAAAPSYVRIQQLLDEAVHGEDIGAHGAFWRTLTRDQFVVKSIFGKKLLALRADGTFDPDESNLVKALEGRAPFGADLVPPPAGAIFNRMPDGFDPMPQVRIDEIRAWITANCPDAPPVEPPWIDSASGGPLPDQRILDYWRQFDNWAMFNATPEVNDAIGAFFDKAPLWMGFAADPAREQAWQAALQEAPLRNAVGLLESRQRDTVVTNFGRPVPLGSLLDAYRRFGDNSLPNDAQRPADMRHNMNGRVMWFMWSAFADACLRLSSPAGIPAPFWNGMARAILVGLMNDGLIRGRFTVNGFPATAPGQDALQQFVRDVPDEGLSAELARRFRESGLPVPPS